MGACGRLGLVVLFPMATCMGCIGVNGAGLLFILLYYCCSSRLTPQPPALHSCLSLSFPCGSFFTPHIVAKTDVEYGQRGPTREPERVRCRCQGLVVSIPIPIWQHLHFGNIALHTHTSFNPCILSSILGANGQNGITR